jgi:hypothetical protein
VGLLALGEVGDELVDGVLHLAVLSADGQQLLVERTLAKVVPEHGRVLTGVLGLEQRAQEADGRDLQADWLRLQSQVKVSNLNTWHAVGMEI